MLNNVTITHRDKDDRAVFRADIKQHAGRWAVFTVSSPVPLKPEEAAALPDLYAAMLKLASRPQDVVISQLGPDDVGRWVEYRDSAGKVEHGRIKGWTDSVVHAVYGNPATLDDWRNYTGQATSPGDLTFVEGPGDE